MSDTLFRWQWEGALGALLVAALSVTAGVGIATLLGLRPLASQVAWFDRARTAQETRGSQLGVGVVLAPFLLALLPFIHSSGVRGLAPTAVLTTILGCVLPLLILRGAAEKRLGITEGTRRTSVGGYLAGLVVALAIFSPSWVVAIVLALLAPEKPGLWCLVIALLNVWAGLLIGAGRTLTLLRLLGLARPAGARTLQAVSRAAAVVGVTPRVTVEVRWYLANAFAFPGAGVVGVSTSALEVLDDEELTAIMAHELAHLTETPAARWARSSLLLLTFPLVFTRLLGSQAGWGVAALLIGVSIFLLLISPVFFRRLESRADTAAAEAFAGPLASALEKLYRQGLMPAVLGARSSHADLYDRMVALGHPPAYPRPVPPSRGRRVLAQGVGLLVGVAVLGTTELGLWVTQPDDPEARLAALQGPRIDELVVRAEARLRAGKLTAALDGLMPLHKLAPGTEATAWLAVTLARLGDCSGAATVLEEGYRLGCATERYRTPLESARRWVEGCQRFQRAGLPVAELMEALPLPASEDVAEP